MSFKLELKELLEKYNATIGFECADCSDLHGVYEERIVVSVSDGRKEILSVDGYYIDQHNFPRGNYEVQNQSEHTMNIFILDTNPTLCAQYHADRHVVKMILESAQMLCTAINEEVGASITPYKSTHKNHPCTRWVSTSRTNALWLYQLMECLGDEYTHRYGKQHLTIQKMRTAKIKELAALVLPNEPLTEFAQAMPDYCKTQTDAVSAYRSYYLNEKRDLLRYTKRDMPYWAE